MNKGKDKKINAVLIFFTVSFFCLIGFSSVVYGSDLFYIKNLSICDENNNQYKDLMDITPGGNLIFCANIINNTGKTQKVSIYFATYVNGRLLQCDVSDTEAENISTEVRAKFNVNEQLLLPEAEGAFYVFDENMNPLSSKTELGYSECGGVFRLEQIYNCSFEDDIPEEFGGDKNINVVAFNGNHVLELDGANKAIQTAKILCGRSDFMISADMKQCSCTAAKNGAFGIGIGSYQSEKSKKLCYIDIYDNGSVNRDCFAAASASDSECLISKFDFIDIGKPVELLQKSTRSTEWFNMSALVNGDDIKVKADYKDTEIWNYEFSRDTDRFLFKKMQNTSGISFFSHSSQIYIDNIKAYAVAELVNACIDVPRFMEKGQWYDFCIYGSDSSGNRYDMQNCSVTFQYDKEKLAIDGNRIMLLDGGEACVRAYIYDSVTDAGLTAGARLIAKEKTENLRIYTEKDNLYKGEKTVFKVFAVYGRDEYEIKDYAVEADGMNVNDGYISSDTEGEHTVKITYGGKECEKIFHVGKTIIIENGCSNLYGEAAWDDYTVQGRFKLDMSNANDQAYTSGFEIVMNSETTAIFGSKQPAVHFVYGINSNKNGYMRIGPSYGGEFETDSSAWHDFSVSVADTMCIFAVDDHTMFVNLSAEYAGGYYFIANNCKVLIDDVKIEFNPPKTTQKNITVYTANEYINVYEVYNLRDLIALKINDGKWFVNYSRINYRTDTEDVIIKDGIVRFGDGFRNNDKIVIQAEYNNTVYTAEFLAFKPDCSRSEYARNTVHQRQESAAYRFAVKSDTLGVDLGSSNLQYLPGLYAKMLLYPHLADYSAAVEWHINEAQYQNTIVGRGVDGGDFVMLQLIALYQQFYGKVNVSDDTWERVKEYLCSVDYPEEDEILSENHMLVYYAIALLCSEQWNDAIVSNMSANQIHEKYKQYIKNWVNRCINRGIMEYNSAHYFSVDIFALEILYTYTDDTDIKEICSDMLNYIYADMIDSSIGDNLGGAQLRVYVYNNITSRCMPLKIMFNAGDNIIDAKYEYANYQMTQMMISSFRPISLLYEVILDQDRRYNRIAASEIYHLPINVEWDNTVVRYTHITPNYILGSKIYVDPSAGKGTNLNGIQEIPWSLRFGGQGQRIVFASAPKVSNPSASNYWTASAGTDKFKIIQHENIMAGIYTDIPEFMHLWLPKTEFKTVKEMNGWIFIEDENAYAAIKLIKPNRDINKPAYVWSDSIELSRQRRLCDTEVKVYSDKAAVVCEAVDSEEYSGSFEEFVRDIQQNTRIEITTTDENVYIEYSGLKDSVGVDFQRDMKYINGDAYLPDTGLLYSSPYIYAKKNGGEIVLSYKAQSYKIKERK